MTKSIGIRVTPSTIYFSIISTDGKNLKIILVDKINNPKALKVPEQLKFLRNTLCDIINEFDIDKACIRITESIAQTPNILRIYIEGVIQELFASSTIKKYYIGQISSISSKLGFDKNQFKLYSEGKQSYLDMDKWNGFSLEERESIMSAISAINL